MVRKKSAKKSRRKSPKKSRRKSPKKSKRAEPNNQKLYDKVKSEAKKKFDAYPSAYASGWIVQEYKRRGGKYKGKKPGKSAGLARWFEEKWIDVCKLPKKISCGRPKADVRAWKKKYPYCRPSKKVTSSTPKTAKELSKKEIQKRCAQKKKSPAKRVMPKKSRRKQSRKK